NDVGTRVVFERLGAEQVVRLLRELLAPEADVPVAVHALYLANNIAVRSAEHCAHLVQDRELLRAIVGHAASGESEVAIGALWCINSIASHRADADADAGEPRFMAALEEEGVQPMLEMLLGDSGLCLGVRDRVKSCLDYFAAADDA
ncbi:hypothetical protein H4S02_005447, partial [Coemansia sp. RSA 2611]